MNKEVKEKIKASLLREFKKNEQRIENHRKALEEAEVARKERTRQKEGK